MRLGPGTIAFVTRWLSSILVAAILAFSAGASARVHVVAPGDSLSEIAARYHVPLRDLRAWNRLEDDTIVVGRALALDAASSRAAGRRHASAPTTHGPSESVGAPSSGSLEGGVQLTGHPAFVLRNRARAYATQRTIDRLRGGFDALLLAEPRAPRVRVHDLSLPDGGAIDDHQTHQSGRDVDITYYQRHGCRGEGCPLRTVAPGELDARRQWRLVHYWLSRGEIEVIYVDRTLQAPLYREARRRGATEAELERWFQYPRPASAAAGLIRHYPNHANHLHVRFACHASETRCEVSRSGP
jgi:LysM repeat protein